MVPLRRRIFLDPALIVFGIILFISVLRIAYAGFVMDPHSGQDAPSYFVDAKLVLRYGFFSPLAYAPYWPVGYTWFISIIWGIFGVDSRALGVIQGLLLTVAIWSLFKLVQRELDRNVALLASLLVSISPALFVSSAEIMYEVPMLSFLLIGANLLSFSTISKKRIRISLFCGAFFLAIAVLIHPSAGAPSLGLLLIVIWRLYKSQMVSGAILGLAFSIFLSGPALNILDNNVAYKGVGYTTTALSNMQLGGWNSVPGVDQSQCLALAKKAQRSPGRDVEGKKVEKNLQWDSALPAACLILTTLKNPIYFMKALNFNASRWISPYTGILKGHGTWYHGLDWRRLLPWYTWWTGSWRIFDYYLCYLWIAMHVGLASRGIYLLLQSCRKRKLRYSSLLFFSVPVAASFLLSAFTCGDTRHRLLISPFYITLISAALLGIASSIRTRFKLKSNLSK